MGPGGVKRIVANDLDENAVASGPVSDDLSIEFGFVKGSES